MSRYFKTFVTLSQRSNNPYTANQDPKAQYHNPCPGHLQITKLLSTPKHMKKVCITCLRHEWFN